MANSMPPYGVSFIQTTAGAMITGEIKRYDTYHDMITDAAPTRLASVSNASRDEDYDVPAEHQGGILYQRDYINSTWILIYTDQDLALPTYVDWTHILNVPPWVGGVSNNRVRLETHTYAQPRTTYYSFGPWRLILPPAADVPLGDEIVLEQYDNYGIVLFEIDPNRVAVPQYAQSITDESTGRTYCYVYTSPLYRLDINDQGEVITDRDGTPIACRVYRFMRTETEAKDPVWTMYLTDGGIERVVERLIERDEAHKVEHDAHPEYILKTDAWKYLTVSIPDATTNTLGGVYLSNYSSDVISTSREISNLVLTVADFKHAWAEELANKVHKHKIEDITDYLDYCVDTLTASNEKATNLIVTPHALTSELSDYSHLVHTHAMTDITLLVDTLAAKQDVLKAGRYIEIVKKDADLEIEHDTINCVLPDATIDEKGIVQLVDVINESNQDSIDVAVTPAALASFSKNGIEEHILHEALIPATNILTDSTVITMDETASTAAGLGLMTQYAHQTMGWIKYPSLRSKKYPGYCLATAWGWTLKNSMKAGLLAVDITKAMQDSGNGTPEVSGSYCVFRHIVHTDLSTISNNNNYDVSLHYRLAFGKPTIENGNPIDVEGLSTLLMYVQPITNISATHNFQVYWKVTGYVLADIAEIWMTENTRFNPQFSISTNQSWADTGAAEELNVSPSAGSTRIVFDSNQTYYSGLKNSAAKSRSWIMTFTIQRVANDTNPANQGLYTIENCKFGVYPYGHYTSARAEMYVDLSGAKIDMRNKKIYGFKVLYRYNTDDYTSKEYNGTTSDTKLTIEEKPTKYPGLDWTNNNYKKWPINAGKQYDPQTRWASSGFAIYYDNSSIIIRFFGFSWVQHEEKGYIACIEGCHTKKEYVGVVYTATTPSASTT